MPHGALGIRLSRISSPPAPTGDAAATEPTLPLTPSPQPSPTGQTGGEGKRAPDAEETGGLSF